MSYPSQEHLAARISSEPALDLTVTQEIVIFSMHHDVKKSHLYAYCEFLRRL